MKRVQREKLHHCSLFVAWRLPQIQASLIVLNEINVSRNPNDAPLLMKADQIRAMQED